jgi:mannose-6-phosphate isomerase-like protein (cupin superfamily)
MTDTEDVHLKAKSSDALSGPIPHIAVALPREGERIEGNDLNHITTRRRRTCDQDTRKLRFISRGNRFALYPGAHLLRNCKGNASIFTPSKLSLACDLPWIVIEYTKADLRKCMMQLFNRNDVEPFVGDDGSIVRELASPANSGLTRHSLAEIRHPPGTASQEHCHTEAEEVYFVLDGQGGVRVDGETRAIGPGDVVVIVPGQRHKVWQEGEGDLVLLVTCVPAYVVEEVVFTE